MVFFMTLDYESFRPATMDESFEKCVRSAMSTRLALIGRRPVQLRNRNVEQTQVYRELAAMMNEMVDRVSQRILALGAVIDVRSCADAPCPLEVGVLTRLPLPRSVSPYQYFALPNPPEPPSNRLISKEA
jgi:hypothetical protein